MYCGQCGKKVMENMLFCPFCGSPIVIPDQGEKQADIPAPRENRMEQDASGAAQPEQKRPVSLFDDLDSSESLSDTEPEHKSEPEPEPFVPLRFDFDKAAEDEAPQEQESVVKVKPEFIGEEERDDRAPETRPSRRGAPELRRTESVQRRAANTYIPVKEIDPEDMFMDGIDDENDYDDYDGDDYDLDAPSSRRNRDEESDDFDFEEPEYGSFFQRHIRGIVGLILLLIVLVVCLVWAVSPKGQLALAPVNLAWKAQPYADLGYDAYQQDSDLLAARYYEKALSRDETNYEYAHSAMVAYYEANEIESAAAMLKKCIDLAPDNPEPYQEMLILYPDAATRPWEISELVRLGYQRTGNEALNIG